MQRMLRRNHRESESQEEQDAERNANRVRMVVRRHRGSGILVANMGYQYHPGLNYSSIVDVIGLTFHFCLTSTHLSKVT